MMAELRQQARELTKEEAGSNLRIASASWGPSMQTHEPITGNILIPPSLYLPTHVCLHHTQYFEVESGESHKSVGNGTHTLKCHVPRQC